MGLNYARNCWKRDINVRGCFMTSGEINMDAMREVHPVKSIGCFIRKSITIGALVQRIKAEFE
jgi:hypothetical protein